MTAVAIDTLQYAKKLRAAGVTQAEAHAEALGEAVRDGLVSKTDLNEAVEKLRTEMHNLHSSLLRWIIPLLIGQTAAFVAIVTRSGSMSER